MIIKKTMSVPHQAEVDTLASKYFDSWYALFQESARPKYNGDPLPDPLLAQNVLDWLKGWFRYAAKWDILHYSKSKNGSLPDKINWARSPYREHVFFNKLGFTNYTSASNIDVLLQEMNAGPYQEAGNAPELLAWHHENSHYVGKNMLETRPHFSVSMLKRCALHFQRCVEMWKMPPAAAFPVLIFDWSECEMVYFNVIASRVAVVNNFVDLPTNRT